MFEICGLEGNRVDDPDCSPAPVGGIISANSIQLDFGQSDISRNAQTQV